MRYACAMLILALTAGAWAQIGSLGGPLVLNSSGYSSSWGPLTPLGQAAINGSTTTSTATSTADAQTLLMQLGGPSYGVYGGDAAPSDTVSLPFPDPNLQGQDVTGDGTGYWEYIPGEGYYNPTTGEIYVPPQGTFYDPATMGAYYAQQAQAYQSPTGQYYYTGQPTSTYPYTYPSGTTYTAYPYTNYPYQTSSYPTTSYPYGTSAYPTTTYPYGTTATSPYSTYPYYPYGTSATTSYYPDSYPTTTTPYTTTPVTGSSIYWDPTTGQWRSN